MAVIRRNGLWIENTLLIPGPESADYMVYAVPHGTVSLQWYASRKGDVNRRAYVYTPAGYEKGNERYPVLYLIHGGSGDEMHGFPAGAPARFSIT